MQAKMQLPSRVLFAYKQKTIIEKWLSWLRTGQPCSNAYRAWSIKNRNS